MQNQIRLNDQVQYLKGVGPKKAVILNKLGIVKMVDLLTYYPREWEDRSREYLYNELQNGLKVSLVIVVEQTQVKRLNKRLGIFQAICSYKGNPISALWFRNISYRYDVFAPLSKKIQPGKKLMLYGVIEKDFAGVSVRVDEYEIVEECEALPLGIVAHYPLTEGVDKRFFRKLIHQALDGYLSYVDENLPERLRILRGLTGRQDAIRGIHMPENMSAKDEARKRLAYEELFFLEYALLLSKRDTTSLTKYARYEIRKTLLSPFKERLGFEFTKAQKHVINELFTDMRSNHPMNRLLQGDVGSGKTVVAMSAMLLAVENGYQSAFMAPTEILAAQHYLTIKNFIGSLDVRIALLTSSITKKEKNKIYEQIASGEIDIVVGTQALIQDRVKFKNLSLVVIDEQHRFGVIQRSKLIQKSPNNQYCRPDVLVMTATPIPRTLALTVYGDLDISVIDELPAGRKMISTLHLSSAAAYAKVIEEVRKGNQAYVVFPLVEESDVLELKSVVSEAEILSGTYFRTLRVGVLHGQLSGAEKETIMKKFIAKEIDVLISTTVIEVGIDVPNATVIVIEDAHRFGLATLHQLRGRVGRSGKQSYCILVADVSTVIGRERIRSILSTNDGFKLGEIDLSLRGPGEFFGVAQHGMPELKIADLINDRALVEYARQDAQNIISASLPISTEDKKRMLSHFKNEYRDSFGLVKIG